MLSLGKLARVAGYTRAEIDTSERVQQSLEVVDDRLDIVASHDRLMDLCRTVIDPRDALKPVETQATVLVGRLCSRVTNAEYIKVCRKTKAAATFIGLPELTCLLFVWLAGKLPLQAIAVRRRTPSGRSRRLV